MAALADGVTIALRSGHELHFRWREFWAAARPWAWFYIAFNLLDSFVYPYGNPSRLMTLLWTLLYLGLTLIIWWNWLGVLLGHRRRVDWSHGWDDPDFREFLTVLFYCLILFPLVFSFVIAVPLSLFMLSQGVIASLGQTLILLGAVGGFLYLCARMYILPVVVAERATPPITVAWELTGRNWVAAVGGFAVLFICNIIAGLMLVVFQNLAINLALPVPQLWTMPLELSVALFSTGWLVLLGYRMHEYLVGWGPRPRAD